MVAYEGRAEPLKPLGQYEADGNIRAANRLIESRAPGYEQLVAQRDNLLDPSAATGRSTGRGPEISPRIVNGVPTAAFPTTGRTGWRSISSCGWSGTSHSLALSVREHRKVSLRSACVLGGETSHPSRLDIHPERLERPHTHQSQHVIAWHNR